MSPQAMALLRTAGVVALVVAYYGVAAARVNGAVTAILLPRLPLGRRLPRLQAEALVRTGVGGAGQLVVLVLLALVGGLTVLDLLPPTWDLGYVLDGVLIGLGELGLSTFVIGVGIHVTLLTRPGDSSREEWFALFRGGWMRAFLTTIRTAPAPVAVGLVALYILVEETVFRGVVLTVARPLGAAAALVLSVALFVTAQLFNMPNWRNALAAAVSAAVVGSVHGLLFLAVPNLLPLLVAHLVLFLGAVL